MDSVYFYCSVVGGSILVIQTVLLLIGIDGGHTDTDFGAPDVDTDVHGDAGDAFFKLLSIKTLTAFITFFGLAGLAAGRGGVRPEWTLLISVGAGSVALYIVASLMRGLSKLQSKGNVRIENAVGETASVYLKIPPRHEGPGKITVEVQGRSLQIKAVTPGEELPTGAEVKVVRVTTPDTVEVVPLEG